MRLNFWSKSANILTSSHVDKSPYGYNSNSDQFCCCEEILYLCCQLHTVAIDSWYKHWKRWEKIMVLKIICPVGKRYIDISQTVIFLYGTLYTE